MDIRDEKFKKLILQAEIAALLHDIGKFTKEFLEAGMGSGSPTDSHSTKFFKKIEKLDSILKSSIPDTWLRHPLEDKPMLKTISDFIRLHHEFDFSKYYDSKEIDHFLLLNYLLIMSDITDSAFSKAGAAFKEKDKRSLRLNRSHLKQNKENVYLASPFGEAFYNIKIETLETGQNEFLKQIESIIHDLYSDETQLTLTYLAEKRNELLEVFYQLCRTVLAETRLPTNDVSLYHHTYATASIFKAMLARHLLLDKYEAWDERKNLVQYQESLAYLGICWNEDELLARSYRAVEIIGRRKILDDAVNKIKNYFEIDLCLGNEIYRDRNGIYFLIPSLEENKDIQTKISQLICKRLENILNSPDSFYGDLSWQVLRRNIGISVLELSSLIYKNDADNKLLGAGPSKPLWIDLWSSDKKRSQEICPHCGLRPRDFLEVTAGSEQDKEKCEQCISIAKSGVKLRKLLKSPDKTLDSQARRLLGVKKFSSPNWTFELEKLFQSTEADEGGRVALINGFFNLYPFISGEAFSSILVARPENFTNPPGKNDKSLEFSNWNEMLEVTELSWKSILNGLEENKYFHTLQQVLQDSYYGSPGDGRIPGSGKLEKARNLIQQIILTAPFSCHISENDDAARIVNYALRLHPSPSRLSWIWDTTRNFMEYIMNWGEEHNEDKKPLFIPLTIDSGSVMLLMRADDKLWQCCSDIYNEYCERFARVRHLLPFHLSVTIFYYKSPLYVAIDAARRFNRLAMEMGEKLWTVREDVKRENDHYLLELEDHRQRRIIWKIPALLPNGKKDTFYSWFWVEGNNRFPVHVSELKQGQQIYVYPSTFDYEILDTTTRRYDIRLTDNDSRPHLFCASRGPRPYPLSVWDSWQDIKTLIKKIDTSQRKHLVEQLGYVHANWHREDEEEARQGLCEDLLNVILGKYATKEQKDKLLAMAMDGSLFDFVEWYDFICQIDKKQEEK